MGLVYQHEGQVVRRMSPHESTVLTEDTEALESKKQNKTTLTDHSPLMEFVVDFIGLVSYEFRVEDR